MPILQIIDGGERKIRESIYHLCNLSKEPRTYHGFNKSSGGGGDETNSRVGAEQIVGGGGNDLPCRPS